MRLAAVVGVVGLLVAGGAWAQAPAEKCAALRHGYDVAMDNANFIDAHGRPENSAPRASVNSTDIANQLSLARLNLEMMQANRCPLPDTPAGLGSYEANVQKCMANTLAGQPSNACTRSTWQADPSAIPRSLH